MNKKIVITSAGNTVFDEKDFVASVIGKNVLFKPVKDLNVGEFVCYDAQFIEKTLEDFEPDLYKDSARYRAAKDSLHIGGQTALSYYLNNSSLLKGLNESEKIIKLHDFVGKKVVKETVKDWLSGKTVLPEPENLGLIADVHPELKDFYEGFQKKKEGLAYPLYDLYNNIRKGLARYSAKPRGSGTGGKKEFEKPLESITLAPEIDIVVKRYFNKINEKMDSVRVTGIKELERKEVLKMSSSGNYEKLKKGVVRIKPENKREFLENNGLNETTFIELLNDICSFEYTLGRYTKKMANEKLKDIILHDEKKGLAFLSPSVKSSDFPAFHQHTFPDDEESYSLMAQNKVFTSISPRNKPIYELRNICASKEEVEFAKAYDKERKKLYSYLEQRMDIEEHNNIEKIIHTVDSLCSSLPSAYIETKKVENDLTDFVNNSFLSNKTPENIMKSREYNNLMNILHKSYNELKDVYGVRYDNPTLKMFKRAVIRHELIGEKGIILTDEDGKTFLKKYEMEELIPEIFG